MPMLQGIRSKLGSQYNKSDTIFTNKKRYSSSVKSDYSEDGSGFTTSTNTYTDSNNNNNDNNNNHNTIKSSISKFKRRTQVFLHIKPTDEDAIASAVTSNGPSSARRTSSTNYTEIEAKDPTSRLESSLKYLNDEDDDDSHKITPIDEPQDESLKDKIIYKAKKLTRDIIHPVEAAKNKVTENITSNFSSLNKDPFQVTNAHIDFANLADDCSIDEHDEKLVGLRKEQKRLLVAWTTERHLPQVRVVNEQRRMWPELQIRRELSMEQRMGEYAKYLGQFTLFLMQQCTPVYTSPWEEIPDFEEPIMRSHIERIVIGSAPWQELFMHVRRVYRWENPKETFKCFGIYIVLWYFQYLISFLYVTIIYTTIMNRWRPPTSKSIRTTINRARSHGETAYHLGELIEKHGQGEWLKKTTEEVGPWVQLQTGDMANLLEVLRNFYEWRSPQTTAYTLIFFIICLAMGILVDLQYCFKMVTFLAGMCFFILFPIASRYPKYRLLVSPTKWIFWGIPTHAEYSCLTLSQEADKKNDQLQKESTSLSDDNDTNIDEFSSSDVYLTPQQSTSNLPSTIQHHSTSISNPPTTLAKFPCLYSKHPGQLIITQSGISFISTIRKNTLFSHAWCDIRALKKDTTSLPKMVAKMTSKVADATVANLDELTIFVAGDDNNDGDEEVDTVYGTEEEEGGRGRRHREETEIKLNAIQRRDEAFNRIIAFSGLRWQGRL